MNRLDNRRRKTARCASETDPSTEPRLLVVRSQTVVLDGDLARLFGVATGQFNRAMKRNQARFPGDFAFRLTTEAWQALRCQIGTLKTRRGQHRKYPAWVFTEHGAIMAATILASPRAAAMSVYVVRAFVRMREELLGRADRERRLAEIERTLVGHDAALRDLYQKLRPLLLPPARPRKEIGFHAQMKRGWLMRRRPAVTAGLLALTPSSSDIVRCARGAPRGRPLRSA